VQIGNFQSTLSFRFVHLSLKFGNLFPDIVSLGIFKKALIVWIIFKFGGGKSLNSERYKLLSSSMNLMRINRCNISLSSQDYRVSSKKNTEEKETEQNNHNDKFNASGLIANELE
jgi:hypothetical protein